MNRATTDQEQELAPTPIESEHIAPSSTTSAAASSGAPLESRALLSLDTLTVVFSFLEHAALGAARLVAHDWRRAALCPTLPAWRELTQQTFVALGSERGSRRGWDFAALELALRAKPCIETIDLSFCRVRWNSATSGALGALPASLQTLTLSHGCAEPRDVLTSLLPMLPSLPSLRRLDLRGVLTMASARGLDVAARIDGWRPPAPPRDPEISTEREGRLGTKEEEMTHRSLPALEYLSVGFSLHSGRRAANTHGGSAACLLREIMGRAPRLRAVGCHVPASLLQPVNVHCRVCGAALYTDLGLHVVHPPQQQHISYEVYTDESPQKAVPSLDSGEDETRLQCPARCLGRMWLIDHGSGFVDRCGFAYAVACGPQRRLHSPGLARLVPRTEAASAAASSELNPLDLQLVDAINTHFRRMLAARQAASSMGAPPPTGLAGAQPHVVPGAMVGAPGLPVGVAAQAPEAAANDDNDDDDGGGGSEDDSDDSDDSDGSDEEDEEDEEEGEDDDDEDIGEDGDDEQGGEAEAGADTSDIPQQLISSLDID